MSSTANHHPNSDNPFAGNHHNTPTDTVFFAIYPDSSLTTTTITSTLTLQSLHLQILTLLSPITSHYIWQHHPFSLSISSLPLPHLSGHLRFGDNLDDEWFLVFLLFHLSNSIPNLSIRVWDSDGEFLLIEAAFHLPKWINPENSDNRVFLRNNEVHIIPRKGEFKSSPDLKDALKFLIEKPEVSRASDAIQAAIKGRISEYPEKARRNVHQVRVRIPVSIAQVLRHEPCLISLAVEGFYDRDIDTMKFAAKMEKFLPKGSGEELVLVPVKMGRAMYAQLMQQKFQAPKWYPMPPMPPRSDQSTYMEAELGMKIACGFEMMYQQRKKEGEEGKGSSWEVFLESLEKSDYFQGLLPGSQEYRRLMDKAEEYYKKSSVHHKDREILDAPVRRIDEILALPHSVDDFKSQAVPPSDDDSWLYGGEEELNSVLMERQREMEDYEERQKRKQKGKDKVPNDVDSFDPNTNNVDLGDIAKSMKAFVHKVSSYQGAEVPESDHKDVEFDMDRFMKELELATRPPTGGDGGSDVEVEEGSSSDMDFDESEDESENNEPQEINEDKPEDFMHAYTDALNEELRGSTLKKSFVRANDQSSKTNEDVLNYDVQGASTTVDEEMEEDFTPVDVDVNLVKSLLDSFSSQQGLSGPASNLLGLMGKQLPHNDTGKDK